MMCVMIDRDEAIEAIQNLCMSDGPEKIWSSDAISAINSLETISFVPVDSVKVCPDCSYERMIAYKHVPRS